MSHPGNYLTILGLCLVSGWLLAASILYWHSHATP